MSTIPQQSPKTLADWANQAKSIFIPIATKVAGGSLLTWSDPRDLAVASIAQECFGSIGTKGATQLAEKVKPSPLGMITLSVMNYGLSFFAGRAIAQYAGFQPSLLSMTAGAATNLGIFLYQVSKFVKEDAFKEAGKIITVTKDNFQQEIENSKVPVILDVYANWCPPCKMVAPLFAKLSEEMDGQVKFVKMDFSKEHELAKTLNVTVIPTFLFFNEGKEFHRVSGVITREQFVEQIERMKQPASTDVPQTVPVS